MYCTSSAPVVFFVGYFLAKPKPAIPPGWFGRRSGNFLANSIQQRPMPQLDG